MKLISDFFENSFVIDKSKLNILVIENKRYYRSLIKSLLQTIKLKSNDFIIIDELEEVDISKYGEIITDIFDIDPNNSKILNKLYKILIKELVETELYKENLDFKNNTNTFIEKLIFNFEYELNYQELDYKYLFKAVDLHIDSQFQGYMARLIEYIDISYKILSKKIFFIVNLDSFFTKEELKDLKEYICYNDIVIVCLQNNIFEENLEDENIKIIDKDLDDI